MNIQETRDKVVNHVKENKDKYIIGAAGVLVGAAGVAAIRMRTPEVVAMNKIVGPSWKPVQTIIQFVERSTPSKPLHKVGTQEYYDSVHDAARKTGHSVTRISKNINGHIPDIGGDVFEVAQQAA
jgi:hypothetical protein